MKDAGAAALLLGGMLSLGLALGVWAADLEVPHISAGVATPSSRGGEKNEALRKLQKRIEREQRAVRAVEAQRASTAHHLQALEQALADEEEQARRAERGAETADRNLVSLQRQMAGLEAERKGLERHVAQRLVALYKFRKVGYVRILLSSKDYQDLARRSRFLRRVVAFDADLVEDYRAKLTTLREETARLDTSRRNLTHLRQLADARGREVQARRREKRILLETLEKEKDSRLETLRDLERAADELQGAVDTLRKAVPSSAPPDPGEAPLPGGFERLRGRLPSPATGMIIRRFGLVTDASLGTQIRSNGITVRAPYGAPIRAVYDGRVLYAGWFRGYGRILIIDHGDGYYTLVAHASELIKQAGDFVQSGEEVARVGDSGSLEGPIVYFEIRKQGKPVDPREWIGG